MLWLYFTEDKMPSLRHHLQPFVRILPFLDSHEMEACIQHGLPQELLNGWDSLYIWRSECDVV